jgi:hypothetical protein
LKNEEAGRGIGNTNRPVAAGHRPQNFYMLGNGPRLIAMARWCNQRRIFALEGDGSLLMQLGSLSTIATLAPKTSRWW